jgi:hypothetical protein
MPYRDVAPAYIRKPDFRTCLPQQCKVSVGLETPVSLGVHPRQKIPIAAGNGESSQLREHVSHVPI